jgi:hypothetical protein
MFLLSRFLARPSAFVGVFDVSSAQMRVDLRSDVFRYLRLSPAAVDAKEPVAF